MDNVTSLLRRHLDGFRVERMGPSYWVAQKGEDVGATRVTVEQNRGYYTVEFERREQAGWTLVTGANVDNQKRVGGIARDLADRAARDQPGLFGDLF